VERWPHPIERLEVHNRRVQRLAADFDGPVIVVAVHAHVRLATAVATIASRGGDVVAAISVPCCSFRATALPSFALEREHEDWGIWSPERVVQLWRPAH
jgi:hypothetical protein